ncbi:MAG: ATP synthase F0 subunit C [Deltaproteobacteria bacterium]|nr:ATP synthase F0 subunit C [Deltaproteobacteria bacterium]
MKKLSQIMIFAVLFMLALSSLTMAAEAETAVKVAGLKVFLGIVIAAGFGIALAAVGTGLAQGIAIKGAVEGTARNPEASGKITVTMLIGLAMIESLCIYTLVVALILLYAYPMSGPIKALVGME